MRMSTEYEPEGDTAGSQEAITHRGRLESQRRATYLRPKSHLVGSMEEGQPAQRRLVFEWMKGTGREEKGQGRGTQTWATGQRAQAQAQAQARASREPGASGVASVGRSGPLCPHMLCQRRGRDQCQGTLVPRRDGKGTGLVLLPRLSSTATFFRLLGFRPLELPRLPTYLRRRTTPRTRDLLHLLLPLRREGTYKGGLNARYALFRTRRVLLCSTFAARNVAATSAEPSARLSITSFTTNLVVHTNVVSLKGTVASDHTNNAIPKQTEHEARV